MKKLQSALVCVMMLLCFNNCWAQGYPQGYFQNPMDTPLMLSAPFGSLRDNHFHSGMDIRTNEVVGLPVYAAADGYVSRIKYSSVGYGKAIYINHPNGYTTVYGHLQEANGEIATYIKQYQYEQEKFEFDHFPAAGKLKVTKGQIIGWSGNSGASTGPHLHFEIRDTRTEQILNPQLLGVMGYDQYSPLIKKISMYSLQSNTPKDTGTYIINSTTLVQRDSVWMYKDTIRVALGLWGIAAEAVDFLHNPEKEYSIYRMTMGVDGKKYFEYKLDRFAFDKTKNINAHIDYARYKTEKIRYQKCFKDDGNKIGIYNYLRNRGRWLVTDTLPHQVKVEVGDFIGNKYSVVLIVKGDARLKHPQPTVIPNQVATIIPAKSFNYRSRDIDITIPAGSLYDTLAFGLSVVDRKPYAYSNAVQVHYPTTPLISSISVGLKPDGFTEAQTSKLLIAGITETGNYYAVGGGYENGWVTAKTSTFGVFTVVADSVAPVIKITNLDKNGVVKDSLGLRIRVQDALSGISSYKVLLNGKWILTEYDAKNDELIYLFDEKTVFGKPQDLVVKITDRKGNAAELVAQIELRK